MKKEELALVPLVLILVGLRHGFAGSADSSNLGGEEIISAGAFFTFFLMKRSQRAPTHSSLLQLPQPGFQLGSVLHSHLGVGVLAQRVVADGQGRFGRQHPGDLDKIWQRI